MLLKFVLFWSDAECKSKRYEPKKLAMFSQKEYFPLYDKDDWLILGTVIVRILEHTAANLTESLLAVRMFFH